jgi:hypothetical protein
MHQFELFANRYLFGRLRRFTRPATMLFRQWQLAR